MNNYSPNFLFSHWRAFLILGVLAGGVYWCHQIVENREQVVLKNQHETEKAWKDSLKTKALDLKNKHTAKVDWLKEIPAQAYTIDIQKTLTKASNQPLLFIGTIKDILGKGYQIEVEVVNQIPWHYPIEEFLPLISLRFFLTGTSEQLEQILKANEVSQKKNPEYPDLEIGYIFVAKIDQIKRRGLQLSTDLHRENDPSMEVTLEDNDEWVALGQLLDIQPLPPWSDPYL